MISHNKTQSGFTLIELLVVIAIIGILASVVMAGLTAARERASDSTIKAEMEAIRTQADLYFLEHDTYGSPFSQYGVSQCNGGGASAGTMFDGSEYGSGAMVDVIHEESDGIGSGYVYCTVGARESWAVAAPLYSPSGSNTGWCADSYGASREVSFDFASPAPYLGGGSSSIAQCP